jgi:hypothetical protein
VVGVDGAGSGFDPGVRAAVPRASDHDRGVPGREGAGNAGQLCQRIDEQIDEAVMTGGIDGPYGQRRGAPGVKAGVGAPGRRVRTTSSRGVTSKIDHKKGMEAQIDSDD